MQLTAFENGPCTRRCRRSAEDHFICERYKDQIIPSKRKSINVMARCFSTKERQQRPCSAALSGKLNTGEWLSTAQTHDARWSLLSVSCCFFKNMIKSLFADASVGKSSYGILDRAQTRNQITFTCTRVLNRKCSLNSRFLIKFLRALQRVGMNPNKSISVTGPHRSQTQLHCW